MNVNPLLWHRTQIRITDDAHKLSSFLLLNILSLQHLMKCPRCLWQWPKLSRVVCLSPRFSVCLHKHWIPGAVQVSRQRRTACIMTTGEFPCGSRLHLLHSSRNRAKTWSPHLFWQPWAGERISVRMGKWVGLGWGGLCWRLSTHWFSFLTLWITAQRATALHLASSTHSPERSAALITQSCLFHPPASIQEFIQQPWNLI